MKNRRPVRSHNAFTHLPERIHTGFHRLRKSVCFFIINIFLMIKNTFQVDIWPVPGGACSPPSPHKACAFGLRLGNRSVFIPDPLLIWFLWDVKEPTPPFEKNRECTPRWNGQPFLVWVRDLNMRITSCSSFRSRNGYL